MRTAAASREPVLAAVPIEAEGRERRVEVRAAERIGEPVHKSAAMPVLSFAAAERTAAEAAGPVLARARVRVLVRVLAAEPR